MTEENTCKEDICNTEDENCHCEEEKCVCENAKCDKCSKEICQNCGGCKNCGTCTC